MSARWLNRFLREPLLHFLLIGGALFVAYDRLNPAGDSAATSHEIVLGVDELGQLALAFQAQWRRMPTPDELSRLVEDRVREEILYREALALGLDQGDTIVKRRMAQKMQFLAEDVAAAREPTPAELESWYASHAREFAQPERISFRHLYFSPDRRGARARDEAAAALEKLARQPRDSALAAALADPFMFQDYYRERAPEQLGKEFGPEFAQAVADLPTGSWQGPIESGLGWHLVYIDSVIPGRVPDFAEIEPDAKAAWLGEQKERAWEQAYQEMRARYTVLLPAPPAEVVTR
jgi:hypothetical protein